MANTAANALGARQIESFLSKIGAKEQQRQEQNQISRILETVQGGGATIDDIVNAARSDPQFDKGLGGLFQKFSSRHQPQPGRISKGIGESVISGRLSEALATQGFTPDERLKARKVKERIEPGSSAALRQVESFEATKAEKAFERDSKKLGKLITDGKAKNSPIASRLRRQLRGNPDLQLAEGGGDFTEDLKGKEKVRIGKIDQAFGETAYNETLQELKDQALVNGFDEASVEDDFNRWWDEKAAQGAKGQPGFGKLVVPRAEFMTVAEVAAEAKPLDDATAQAIMQEVGGDKDKARKLAAERGFTF